jgi:two-component system NarL family sensor kinase
VHRHSGSPTVAIRIANVANQLRVEVEDAGKGIPPQKQSEMISAGKAGVGMSGMRERLRQFGGELEVNSAPGHTVVSATIPRSQAKTASAS